MFRATVGSDDVEATCPTVDRWARSSSTCARSNLSAEGLRTMRMLLILSLAAMSWSLPARADGPPLPLGELAKPGRVLMLRHAHAPGFGDPPNFVIGDCSTQRNLDASGRAQARQLGDPSACGRPDPCASLFEPVVPRARNGPPAGPWAGRVLAGAEFLFRTAGRSAKDSGRLARVSRQVARRWPTGDPGHPSSRGERLHRGNAACRWRQRFSDQRDRGAKMAWRHPDRNKGRFMNRTSIRRTCLGTWLSFAGMPAPHLTDWPRP
jgi:hypothetical protein